MIHIKSMHDEKNPNRNTIRIDSGGGIAIASRF
jgi:hypothetical protein